MAEKVRTRSGSSLADTYEVQGSIAGVDELDQESVKVVHEMGNVIQSERMTGDIMRVSTGAIGQSVIIGSSIFGTAMPPTPYRIVALNVFSSNAARVANIAVLLRNREAATIREVAIWAWDAGANNTVRIVDDGGPSGNVEMLIPTAGLITNPVFMVGRAQPKEVSELVMRGATTAFGVGTVTVTLVVYIAFPNHEVIGGSVGLPIPSW